LSAAGHSPRGRGRGRDLGFVAGLWTLAGLYLLLILALLFADVLFIAKNPSRLASVDWDPIWHSITLTLITCTISALLSVLFAVPIGYLLSRTEFRGKALVDAVLDIPIVLPPLVIGLSLLILFNHVPTQGHSIEKGFNALGLGVTYAIPAVILAQFTVACAFAVRTMVNTYDQLSPRYEDVAMTLGCSRAQAFWRVVVPESWRGILTAGTLAWARALGEFGPILVFAGATRGRTEVMSTTVFLEISIGNIEGAVVVSLLMVAVALVVLVLVRVFGSRRLGV